MACSAFCVCVCVYIQSAVGHFPSLFNSLFVIDMKSQSIKQIISCFLKAIFIHDCKFAMHATSPVAFKVVDISGTYLISFIEE